MTTPTVHRALARSSATVLGTLLLWAPSVSAQEADRLLSDSSTAILPHSETPVVGAVRTSSSIRIDGMPDEAAWASAMPMTVFTQIDPNEGEPVSQPTDVRFLFDDDALYIGGRFYDSGPIMTRLARRDAGVSDSDLFTISIDSYHDHQTSYRFTTNPSGLKRDATVTSGGGMVHRDAHPLQSASVQPRRRDALGHSGGAEHSAHRGDGGLFLYGVLVLVVAAVAAGIPPGTQYGTWPR